MPYSLHFHDMNMLYSKCHPGWGSVQRHAAPGALAPGGHRQGAILQGVLGAREAARPPRGPPREGALVYDSRALAARAHQHHGRGGHHLGVVPGDCPAVCTF